MNLPRHQFWGAGEPNCPPELKAPNGELHTMRCKVCGDGWRKSSTVCLVAASAADSIRAALADGVKNAGSYRTGVRVAPFKVYGRAGEQCQRCPGTVQRIVQATRSTYFCPRCQKK